MVFKKITLHLGLSLTLLYSHCVLADVPDPTQPPIELKAASATVAQPTRKSNLPVQPEFSLQSIMIGPSRKFAIINGIALAEGETIKGATVSRIEPNQVELGRKGKTIQLKLLQVEVKQAVAASGSLEE
ncbi:MAG TPA: hypothetical protein VFM46_04915 [Pseudomonadales bacterium]|nr:hypothetical protein [Pseudomonadales bacterium]